ncbi:TetR/AcrR family transcriptional regulator [Mycobacterium sp. pUA109]|uniref:TetR/AcrR family transcriptional regulator n=1 Tax=Mycobacterium sp. pUA109 TaxID=3238982 RepID=UPI00351B1435
MPAKTTPPRRRRGRPPGGGNEPEQAREALLDAAERSMVKYGYRASTMEVIAREAGYTRTMIYRHFSTRGDVDEALLKRVTLRQISRLTDRLGRSADLPTLIMESSVMVATELAHDPLFAVFAEHTETGNVAHLLSNVAPYLDFVESLIVQFADDKKSYLRPGLRPRDAVHFLMASALGLLLGLVPGSDDPDQVRRYVKVFVFPAVLPEPPRAGPVFDPL